MGAPLYSPTQGNGATSTDAQGNTYTFNNGTWNLTTSAPAAQSQTFQDSQGNTYTLQNGQYVMTAGPGMSSQNSNANSGNMTSAQVQQLVQQLLSAQSTPAPAATPTPVTLDLSKFNFTDMATAEKAILADSDFTQYYQQLMTQAGGDYTEAIRSMNAQLSQGTTKLTAQTQLDTQNQVAQLQNSLQQLGLQKTTDTNSLLDTLNKRGIAVTQAGGPQSASTQVATPGTTTYDANGNPTTTGQGGEAGTELSNLSEDYALRQEAENRTTQYNLQNIGLTQSSGQAALQETATEQQQAAQSKQVTSAANIQNEEAQAAAQQAQATEQQQQAQASTAIQLAQLKQSGANVTGTAQNQVNTVLGTS